jgi:hypothetical protein
LYIKTIPCSHSIRAARAANSESGQEREKDSCCKLRSSSSNRARNEYKAATRKRCLLAPECRPLVFEGRLAGYGGLRKTAPKIIGLECERGCSFTIPAAAFLLTRVLRCGLPRAVVARRPRTSAWACAVRDANNFSSEQQQQRFECEKDNHCPVHAYVHKRNQNCAGWLLVRLGAICINNLDGGGGKFNFE